MKTCGLCNVSQKDENAMILHWTLFHFKAVLCQYLKIDPNAGKEDKFDCPKLYCSKTPMDLTTLLIHYFLGHEPNIVVEYYNIVYKCDDIEALTSELQEEKILNADLEKKVDKLKAQLDVVHFSKTNISKNISKNIFLNISKN
jgi:hypothetical protein